MAVLQQNDLVKAVTAAIFKNHFAALTVRNLEVVLEDINILKDRNVDLQIDVNRPIDSVLSDLCDHFDEHGFETSWAFYNAARFCIPAKVQLGFQLTVDTLLEFTRSLVGTVNTSLRYHSIED